MINHGALPDRQSSRTSHLNSLFQHSKQLENSPLSEIIPPRLNCYLNNNHMHRSIDAKKQGQLNKAAVLLPITTFLRHNNRKFNNYNHDRVMRVTSQSQLSTVTIFSFAFQNFINCFYSTELQEQTSPKTLITIRTLQIFIEK